MTVVNFILIQKFDEADSVENCNTRKSAIDITPVIFSLQKRKIFKIEVQKSQI